jgi:membrane protease YdiL (CAAX protease family)
MRPNVRAFVYLAITFLISWAALTIAWLRGARTSTDAGAANLLFLLGPPIAALACALMFEKGHRVSSLGLKLKPNRWWLVAIVLPIAVMAYSGVIEAVLGRPTAPFTDPRTAVAALLKLRPEVLPNGVAGIAVMVILIAVASSIVFALTEEMGWRGYLYRQWRPLGFWRYSLLTGLIWGVWHWPMVIYFGLVFSDHRLAGLAYYPLSTLSLAPLMTLLRDKDRSIWAPGLYHGVANTIGIVLMNDLGRRTAPEFLPLLLMLPTFLLVELFRRKWPERGDAEAENATWAVLGNVR